jgi:hypothetical protein
MAMKLGDAVEAELARLLTKRRVQYDMIPRF